MWFLMCHNSHYQVQSPTILFPIGNKLETSSGREFGGFKKKDGFASSVTGLKALGVRELSYKLSFAACMVTPCASAALSSLDDFDYSPTFDSFSQDEKMDILAMKNTPNLYQKLVESIAPSIFGTRRVLPPFRAP